MKNSFALKGYFLPSIIQFAKDFLHAKFLVCFVGYWLNITKHNYKISADLCNQVLTILCN